MPYVLYQNELSPIADRIAQGLLDDLKAKKLPKVGIEEIRAAIAREIEHDGLVLDERTADALEAMTTRKLVYKADEQSRKP